MSRLSPSTIRCARATSRRTTAESSAESPSSRVAFDQPARQQLVDAVAPQQVVVERDEEAGTAGVALPAGAPAELIVDARALVAVGADDVEPAERHHRVALRLVVAAELDVGAAARHVGRDGDGAERARLGDDRRFPLVLLGVEHLVRNRGGGELRREAFRVGHARGADQDRTAALVRGARSRRGVPRSRASRRAKRRSGSSTALAGAVRWDAHRFEPVHLRGARSADERAVAVMPARRG